MPKSKKKKKKADRETFGEDSGRHDRKKCFSDALKDKRSINKKAMISRTSAVFIDEVRFCWINRCRPGKRSLSTKWTCRRCTTRILDDAVLERKLGDNRKTREDVRELRTKQGEKIRVEKNEEFTVQARRVVLLPLFLLLKFFWLSRFCFSRETDVACRIINNKRREKKRRGGRGREYRTVGKCASARRVFFCVWLRKYIYININIYLNIQIYV